MKSRITISLTKDGDLEIWLNEKGRDQLVSELQNLGPQNDHFHLGPVDIGEVELSSRPYRTSDKLIEFEKSYSAPMSGTGNTIPTF